MNPLFLQNYLEIIGSASFSIGRTQNIKEIVLKILKVIKKIASFENFQFTQSIASCLLKISTNDEFLPLLLDFDIVQLSYQ